MNLGLIIFLGSIISLTFVRFALPKRLLNRRRNEIRDYPLHKNPQLSKRLRNKVPVHTHGKKDQPDSRAISEQETQDFSPSQSSADLPISRRLSRTTVRLYVSIILSLIILATSIYVILNDSYDDATEKWALGALGTILGYWLKD